MTTHFYPPRSRVLGPKEIKVGRNPPTKLMLFQNLDETKFRMSPTFIKVCNELIG